MARRNHRLKGLVLIFFCSFFSAIKQVTGTEITSEKNLIFGVQAGSRWLSARQQRVMAEEYVFQTLTILPYVPIEAGASIRYLRFNRTDYRNLLDFKKLDHANGYSVSLNVRYRFPVVRDFKELTPWILYMHEVYSAYRFKGNLGPSTKMQVNSGTNGYGFGFGMDIRLSEILKGSLALAINLQTIENHYQPDDPETIPPPHSRYALDSGAILLGAETAF